MKLGTAMIPSRGRQRNAVFCALTAAAIPAILNLEFWGPSKFLASRINDTNIDALMENTRYRGALDK